MSAFLDFNWPYKSNYAERLVTRHSVDLRNMVVLTEAATGPYSAGPLIAATAHAKEIHCVAKDSDFGTADDAWNQVRAHLRAAGLDESSLRMHSDAQEAPLEAVNIVTNCGNLRPIDASLIDRLTPGRSTILLMWEPWEFREGEIDIRSASRRGIPVVGTNEHCPPNDLRGFTRTWALHLLASHGEPVVGSRIGVVGDQLLIADNVATFLEGLGAEVRRIRTGDSEESIRESLTDIDYVLVAEHSSQQLIIGAGGLIETTSLLSETRGSYPKVGNLCGMLDLEDLRRHGIDAFPDIAPPPGFLAYPPWALGYPLPMSLFAAGLKVGQVVVNELLQGSSATTAVEAAVRSGYGMRLDQ